jgi:hypothetical protein
MQKGKVYLGISSISLIVSIVSEVAILRDLFEARFEFFFWYPLLGGIIGIVFGILAKPLIKKGCVVVAIITLNTVVFIIDFLLKFFSLVIFCYTC